MKTTDKSADVLTDRDYDLHEHEQGLYRKFDVRRVDGSSEPGGKHHDCEYFVLDMMHDQHARAALRAYADACASTHPELSADLIARYGLSHVEQPAAAPIDEPVAAWINYPVKTVDGEFAGYEKPELSFTRPAYGYDITMAEPLYRRAPAPAVAPIDIEARFIAEHGHRLAQLLRIDAFDIADRDAQIMAALKDEHAPTPADERAAFEAWWVRDVPVRYRSDTLRVLRQSRELDGKYGTGNIAHAWKGWQARASSANETGADGQRAQIEQALRNAKYGPARLEVVVSILEDVLAASPVEQPAAAPIPADCDVRAILLDVVPGESGEGEEVYAKNVDDVRRVLSEMGERLEDISAAAPTPAQAAEPVAWVRKHPDTGELSGDWLWNDVIEQCRKDSGVWFPLGFLAAPPPPAPASAPVDVEAMLRSCVPGGDIVDPQLVCDNIREWFSENPEHASAPVGLTVYDLRVIEKLLVGSGYIGVLSRVRALLEGDKQ